MSNVEGVLEKILAIVNSHIDDSAITADQNDEDLVAMGMDSIKFISIVVMLEEVFEIEYPDEYLLVTQSNTLQKLVSIVSETLEKKKPKE